MALLIIFALISPKTFTSLLSHPDFYLHAKFIHILSVTLFFANAVIGTFWETKGLLSKNPELIRYTYQTVSWMDAVFTAPLILLAVISGISLGTILGGIWTLGWLSVAFVLFLFSGALWIAIDIPTQYKINRLFQGVEKEALSLPRNLTRLLWARMGINLFTLLPLLVIFYLMIHKPQIQGLAFR
jgi:uncharacterized membrane protein